MIPKYFFCRMADGVRQRNVGTESKKPDNSAFKQQRLPAWQPVLTAKSVLPGRIFTRFISQKISDKFSHIICESYQKIAGSKYYL